MNGPAAVELNTMSTPSSSSTTTIGVSHHCKYPRLWRKGAQDQGNNASRRLADFKVVTAYLAALPFAQRLQARTFILNGLEVSVERGAGLISVRFEANEPRTPPLVVNAVLRAYDDIYGDQGTERRGHRLSRLRENQRTLQQELNIKRRALTDFMATTEYGAAEIGSVLSMKLVRIEELKQELDLLDLAIGAAVDQGDQARGSCCQLNR